MDGISVIVPVYNTAAYLPKCLDSILNQTKKPREVIIVDDGSTDESPALCDCYARRYPDLIRVLHQDNQGLSAARNAGIEKADGSCLSFVDSDDYLEKDAYFRLEELLDTNQADVALGEMTVEEADGRQYRRMEEDISLCWDKEEALIQLCSYRYLYNSFCTGLYRRTAIGDLRFPRGKLSEDYYLMHHVIARCQRVAYTSQPVYHYVQRPGSISRTKRISHAPAEASLERLSFFRERFPALAWAAETDCAFAHMSVINAYIRNGVDCPREIVKEYRTVCRDKLGSVLRNPEIPKIKKGQALMFCYCLPAYKTVIASKAHR